MRRISTGVIGREILGRFTAFENSLQSIEENQDIVLSPNGTGIVQSDADLQINNENSVRFADSGSSNFIEIKAPSSLASNSTLTLPPDAGTEDYVLSTDGSGNLSWESVAVSVSNETADTNTYYPLLSQNTNGQITSVTTSSSKLDFQPSSGTLTVDNLTVSSDFQADTITETSSLALKTDIEPITDANSIVSALTGVNYTRISSGQREAGLIAEDVEKILPELVSGSGDNKAISYSRLSAYLIEAVKTLQIEINELKKIGNGTA